MSSGIPLRTIRVDNKCLVIRSGVKLPAFCVKSNQPVKKSEYGPRKIKWTKETFGPKLIRIISYFMSRQYCDISYGLENSIRVRTKVIFFIKLALTVICFFGMFTGAALMWNQFVILAFVAIGMVAAICLPFGNQPLAIVREENGEFWLKGCSKEFLARFK